ncbi:MAG: DNA alkylation repair protein [Alistipes sp.]|nr:DNA alkylation repair protein [Alistipes sp.]
MDHTSRMVALLAAMRRERNGAVAGGMRCHGAPYGLNYGVSLPTVRAIARVEEPDHAFARMLYRQEVRELRLVALHVASPSSLTLDELPAWAAGIINSEVAEEAAFALLGRAPILPLLFERWVAAEEPLLVYAALMAAARWPAAPAGWASEAVGALRRIVSEAAQERQPAWAERLVLQGVTALLAAVGAADMTNRQAVLRAADSLGDTPAGKALREELAWRLEA